MKKKLSNGKMNTRIPNRLKPWRRSEKGQTFAAQRDNDKKRTGRSACATGAAIRLWWGSHSWLSAFTILLI
jgi:hypothetical protein